MDVQAGHVPGWDKGHKDISQLQVHNVTPVLHPGELCIHTQWVLGGDAELHLTVSLILSLNFRFGQGKMWPFSLGDVSQLRSAMWEISLWPFSPYAELFYLQMAVGKDQLCGLILMA